MSPAVAGLTCLVLSCLFYAALLIVPFLPLDGQGRTAAAVGLVVLGEGIFWVGCLLAGRELMRRYRHWLNPRAWFERPSGSSPDPKSPGP